MMKLRFFLAMALTLLVLGTVISVSAQRSVPLSQAVEHLQQGVDEPSVSDIAEGHTDVESVAPVLAAGQEEQTDEEQTYVTAQALRRYAQTEILTQVVNRVEMSVANLRLAGNAVTVDVCYQIPKFENEALNQMLGDWLILWSELKIGEESLAFPSGALIEYSTKISEEQNRIRIDPEFLPGKDLTKIEEIVPGHIEYDCRRLKFSSGRETNNIRDIPGEALLVIHSLDTIPREGQFCSFYEFLGEELRSRGIELRVECIEQDGWASKKIEGMDEKDLMNLIIDEFWRYKGPWEFRLPLK